MISRFNRILTWVFRQTGKDRIRIYGIWADPPLTYRRVHVEKLSPTSTFLRNNLPLWPPQLRNTLDQEELYVISIDFDSRNIYVTTNRFVVQVCILLLVQIVLHISLWYWLTYWYYFDTDSVLTSHNCSVVPSWDLEHNYCSLVWPYWWERWSCEFIPA